MKVRILSDTNDSKIEKMLGTNSLIAPTPVVVDDGLLIAFGIQRNFLKSEIALALTDINLKSCRIISLDIFKGGGYPDFAAAGAVPTCLTHFGDYTELIFSGFSNQEKNVSLRSGVVIIDNSTLKVSEIQKEPLIDPSGNLLCASASRSLITPKRIWFAQGGKSVQISGSRHPESEIWDLPLNGVKRIQLQPGPDEFALTRPMHFMFEAHEILLFSKRLFSGDYLQGLSVIENDSIRRIDDRFVVLGQEEKSWMYSAPFLFENSWYLCMAQSRLGHGGFYIGKIEALEI